MGFPNAVPRPEVVSDALSAASADAPNAPGSSGPAGADPAAPPTWQILRRCTEGPDESWSTLVARTERLVTHAIGHRLALRRVTGVAVEDLVQEAYVRLVVAWERPSARFRGTTDREASVFLWRLAERVALDTMRGSSTVKRNRGMSTHPLDGIPEKCLMTSPDESAEQRLLARERTDETRRRLRQPAGERASARSVRIVELALVDGLTSREIVARSGGRLSVSGVDTVLFRFRRRLASAGVELPAALRRGPRPARKPRPSPATHPARRPRASRATRRLGREASRPGVAGGASASG